MIYAAELANLANRFENLHLLTHYSQSAPTSHPAAPPDRWHEKSGYINADDLHTFVPDIKLLPVFLCGPDPMMKAVRKTLVSLGVPNEQISTEEFVSPKANVSNSNQATDRQPQKQSETPSHTSSQRSFPNTQTELQSATIRFELSNQTIDIDTSTTILEAAEQARVALPWECRAGICGQCKVRCTSGRVQMDSRDAITKAEEANGFILACQSHPTTESVSIQG